ncbi:TniQ family protein [Cytobacillus dafuensis]|nr:TniQ family protein [Cytobacillus dafuensis]
MEQPKLTIRIKPNSCESLTSYLIRLSNCNEIALLSLLNYLRVKKGYFQMSEFNLLDLTPVNNIDIDKLAYLTNLNKEILLSNTFFHSLNLFSDSDNLERARLMSGVFRSFLSYCPCCLKEKRYYNLLWKIDEINVCMEHSTKLQESCPRCFKKMHFKDIKAIGSCPYCYHSLIDADIEKVVPNDKDKWLTTFWSEVRKPRSDIIFPDELAIKILFILSNKNSEFDKKQLLKKLKNPGKIPVILQHARGSLSNKRTLHLSFIKEVLCEYRIDINELITLQVPDTFKQSILMKKKIKLASISCIAPWCSNFEKTGCLEKLVTNFKRRADSNDLLYYMYCPSCFCEYALNVNGETVERTNFIMGYNALKDLKHVNFHDISYKSGLSIDQLKRCIGYFSTRNVFEININHAICKESLLNLFEAAIKDGTNINVIKKWSIWNNYQEFLSYRYHHAVLAVEKSKVKKQKDAPVEKSNKINQLTTVEDTLKQFLTNDKDITINNVCSELKVSPETIRSWGGNELISTYKNMQKESRLEKQKNELNSRAKSFFKSNDKKKILNGDLYNYLGVGRTIVWRNHPELAYLFSEMRKEHNTLVQSQEKSDIGY